MEQESNLGVISICDSREVADALKKYYRDEYKRIQGEMRKKDFNYIKSRITIFLGHIGVNIGLTFASKPVKSTGKKVSSVLSGLFKLGLKIKHKIDKNKLKKQLEMLDANFVNLEGNFKEIAYDMSNSTGELLEVQNQSENTKKLTQ